MAKYRKRSKVVEAVQWHGPRKDGPTPTPAGVFRGDDGQFFVVTIHGQPTPLAPGDWVITEPDGEHHYPCKPDIFADSYDPVESTEVRVLVFDEPCYSCSAKPAFRVYTMPTEKWRRLRFEQMNYQTVTEFLDQFSWELPISDMGGCAGFYRIPV